jgi:hypothetical protein
MNTRILATIVCLTLLGEYAYSQNAPDPKGKNNAVSGLFPPPFNQWNKFPNWGNAGIGTTSPSEKLEVIGNVKISQIVFTHALESSTYINSGTLNLSGNGIINGNLGLGVPSPTERLDVLGNIKLSGNLTAQGLNIQTLNSNGGVFNTLTINQNSLFNGPSTFGENVSFSKDVVFNGKVGIGIPAPEEKLHIAGNLKVSEGISSATVTTTNLQTSQINATGDITTGQNLNVTGNTTLNTLDVSSTLKSKILDIEDGSVSGNMTIVKDFNTLGNATLNNLKVIGTFTMDNLDLSVGKDLAVIGNTQLKNGVSITGDASVSGGLTVAGAFTAGSLSIDNVSTTGDATVSQNLSVLGAGQVGGDLNVSGNLKAGIIEATEFRTADGSSPFNFDNAKITETLTVGTDKAVPSNYKVAVGGNIIATGIDIKIPQKWPDYVFTDGHKLLTIEEVKKFIEEHGHLPNVLSAKEMEEKENYSVSEMDAKLMEKIEELTLYIIKQNEEMEQMRKDINALMKK